MDLLQTAHEVETREHLSRGGKALIWIVNAMVLI